MASDAKLLTPPQQPVANIEYRKKIRAWATDPVYGKVRRELLIDRCRDDYFFFLETFGWVFEPRIRKGRSAILPFIPWPHQRPVMEGIIRSSFPDGSDDDWEPRDIGIEKARGEGATYICLSILLWRWLFHRNQSFAIVSRGLDFADNPENPDSLGYKLDWMLARLPKWMVGERGMDWSRNIARHSWVRYFEPGDSHGETSTISAYPSTGDLGAGGRKTAIMMDELGRFPRGDDEKAMSASEPVTDCRWLVSTYSGADGAYYNAMQKDSSINKLYLRWEDNPTRNEGLFCIDTRNKLLVHPDTREPVHIENGYADKFFDEYFPLLVQNGFNVETATKLWSPWYVSRCARAGMSPQWIAQEYDRDPTGSSATFFSGPMIGKLMERARKPMFEGEPVLDHEKLVIKHITPHVGGHLKLWLRHHGDKIWSPPSGNYVIGVDVSAGTGASYSSNSVASIVDADIGRKVGEFTASIYSPEKFAEVVVALCKMFQNVRGGPAYLIWECNGPGTQFREQVLSTEFRNFYYRTSTKSSKRKPTREPGWWSSKDVKREVLGGYRWALAEGHFDNPCAEALAECLRYQELSGGRLEYVTDAVESANEAGERHGDRVIADALANLAMEELGGGRKRSVRQKMIRKSALNPPDGSFLFRRMAAKKAQKTNEDW